MTGVDKDTLAVRVGSLRRRLTEIEAAIPAPVPEAGDAATESELDASPAAPADPSATLAVAADAVAVSEAATDMLARTYRGLRLIMVGAAPAIFIAVYLVWAFMMGGADPPTLSHYYYSPAGIVFVGALVTAAAALVALSGHGAERTLLDIAAFFCPLIALIPTPLDAHWAVEFARRASDTALTESQTKAIEEACAAGCVPPPFDRYVAVSLAVWAVIVVAVLALTYAGARRARSAGLPVPASTWVTIRVVTALLIVYAIVWCFFRPFFLTYAHVFSASTFLILLAIVAILQPRTPTVRTRQQVAAGLPATAAQHRMKRSLRWIGVLMLAVLSVVIVIFMFRIDPETTSFPTVVLWVEVASLSLFTAFWFIQTRRKWNAPDA